MALASTTLCAFDLIELDGTDYRLTPIEDRKRALRKLLRKASSGVVINEHFEDERRDHIPRSLPAPLRRYCVEAARLAVPIGPIQAMDQGQEPGCAGRAARG